MKTTRIRIFKFSDSKENLQFHWPYVQYYVFLVSASWYYTLSGKVWGTFFKMRRANQRTSIISPIKHSFALLLDKA